MPATVASETQVIPNLPKAGRDAVMKFAVKIFLAVKFAATLGLAAFWPLPEPQHLVGRVLFTTFGLMAGPDWYRFGAGHLL